MMKNSYTLFVFLRHKNVILRKGSLIIFEGLKEVPLQVISDPTQINGLYKIVVETNDVEGRIPDMFLEPGLYILVIGDIAGKQTSLTLSGKVNIKVNINQLVQKDIEALGWEKDIEQSEQPYIYNRYFYTSHVNETYQLTHSHVTGISRILHKESVRSSKCIFHGKCKNYNELKTIMKQIGIWKD